MSSLEERNALLKRENERLRTKLAEQKRALDLVQKREERLRKVFTGTPAGILIAVAESRKFTYANPAICRMLGYTEQELLELSVMDIHPPKDVEWVLAEFVSQVQGEKVLLSGIPCRCKDGTILYVDIVGTAMVLGGTMCSVGFFTDVTARRHMEDALHLTEHQYRATIDAMGDAIHVVDQDLRIVLINQAFIKWNTKLGLRTEMIGRTVSEMFPFLPERVRDEYHHVFTTAESLVSEEQVAVGDRSITTEVRKIPVLEGDQVVRAVTIVRDITERKQAEYALRKSEERYRTLAETAHDMIFVVDRDDRVSYVNQHGARSLNRCPEDIIGKPRALFFPEDISRRQHQNLCRVFEHGEPIYAESAISNPRGEMWLGTWLAPIRDQDGTITSVMGVSRNITGQRLLEERLRQAQKMESIGQLAGGVAHDFNNQLAGIMGYASLLTNLLKEEPQRSYAQKIVDSAQRSADLTQQLLAFSRKGKYVTVAVDIHQLIGEVVDILKRSIDKRIVIRQELRASPPTVMGDPTQIQNAFLNLALNARDAMPEGGDLIFETDIAVLDAEHCRSCAFEITPGPYLCLKVIDTGCGMSEEVKQHLFEPFFTTKEVGEGSGMGLASVYGTVRNHAGSIAVTSDVGQGTTFRICLPHVPSAPKAKPKRQVVRPSRGSAQILLVDDERTVREMGAALLEDLGYRVASCADGQEAVEYYRGHWKEVDLVILDMIMPRMGGREAFIAMQRINPQIRAVLSSGYSMEKGAQDVLQLGVLGFIGKPYEQSQLAREVEEALAHSAS